MPEKCPMDDKFWDMFETQLLSAGHEMAMSDDTDHQIEGRFYKEFGPAARRFFAAEQARGVKPANAILGFVQSSANLCALMTIIFAQDTRAKSALRVTALAMAKTARTFPANSCLDIEIQSSREKEAEHE